MPRFISRTALILALFAFATSTHAAEPKRIAPDRPIATMTVVSSRSGIAVVRFGVGPLTTIRTGDRVGRSASTVKEISSGCVVLDDVEAAGDREIHALVIVKVGETGGTRVLREPPENPPSTVRVVTVSSSSAKLSIKR